MRGKGSTEVDHKNRNKLDNRAANLRAVTPSEQAANRGKNINNSSGYKGVYKVPSGKWVAKIMVRGKSFHLGTFCTEEEASREYQKAADKHFCLPERKK